MTTGEWLSRLFQAPRRGSPEAFAERLGAPPDELFTGGLWCLWWTPPTLAWWDWGKGIRAGKPCPVEGDSHADAWAREAWETLDQLYRSFVDSIG